MTPRPRLSPMLVHEGLPLLFTGRRLKGSIGPGGRIEVVAEEEAPRIRCKFCVLSLALLLGIILLVEHPTLSIQWSTKHVRRPQTSSDEWELLCNNQPCFEREMIRVAEDRPAFPSFWNYAPHGPISVTYDERALLLNGTRVLFLSGSMHPARATPSSWENALDEAVRQGLNMITLYVVWAVHQPFSDMEMDWSLPGSPRSCNEVMETPCGWTLASAIRAAANRGLFVHARIGPYICAEYSYGGIPEWIPLNKPDMNMRRPNQPWMDVMETYTKSAIQYLTENNLWAHQGGPILMGQIENELGGNANPDTEHLVVIESSDGYESDDIPPSRNRETKQAVNQMRNSTLQDYADWSGTIAAKYAPKVLWTMCNGLTAPNTINTCNGFGEASCSDEWLESHGQSGRIQIDQPALWTEDEAGFQIWGESAENPTDYFWGRTARSVTRDALKWFARGGSHLNYYMWAGFYNRGRSAAAGITNMYASDASGLCSSGQRRQPTFGHLQSFHQTIIDIAPILLAAPTALGSSKSIEVLGVDKKWAMGTDQRMFTYDVTPNKATNMELQNKKEVTFIENDANSSVVVRIIVKNTSTTFVMAASSGMVLMDGMIVFDSQAVDPRTKAFKRDIFLDPVLLLDWSSWIELVGTSRDDNRSVLADHPIEQTELMHRSRMSSDFAWFTTDFFLPEASQVLYISVECQMASAMSFFINGNYFGTVDHHLHNEGNVNLTMDIRQYFSHGQHTLSLLSESLGYGNLIGRWGASTTAKTKGITGNVFIVGREKSGQIFSRALVDGREWLSFPGLHGEYKDGIPKLGLRHERGLQGEDFSSAPCAWSRALFDTPSFDDTDLSLFLDISSGRGRIWLNGHDLGRFWNITKGDTTKYSQQYYFLPHEFLYSNGKLNDLLLFNSLGGDTTKTKLVLSGIVEDENGNFEDEVDFPGACI